MSIRIYTELRNLTQVIARKQINSSESLANQASYKVIWEIGNVKWEVSTIKV